MKKTAVLFVMLVVVTNICAIVLLVHFNVLTFTPSPNETAVPAAAPVIDTTDLEYAAALEKQGLLRQAAEAVESYMQGVKGDKKAQAAHCYKAARLYLEAQEFDKALGLLYKAEFLDPSADYMPQVRTYILEVKNRQFPKEKPPVVKPEEPPVPVIENDRSMARIGGKKIYESEILRALTRLSSDAQKEFATDVGKARFIREYVTSEALYVKAKKLGLDTIPLINEKVNDYKKQLVLQELIQKNIDEHLKISDEELMEYYVDKEARFTQPAAVKISYVPIAEGTDTNEYLKTIKDTDWVVIDAWITEKDSDIPGLGVAPEAIARMCRENKGAVIHSIPIGTKTYAVSIDDKKERDVKSFSEVRESLEGEFIKKKQRDIVDVLIVETLKSEDVEIFVNHPDTKNARAVN